MYESTIDEILKMHLPDDVLPEINRLLYGRKIK